jgi:cell division protein FtsI (penicillin-binding protein 3)
LHILQREFLQGEGDARTIRTVPLVANRGLITDRNGEPLAVSTPVKSLWVDPSEIAGNGFAIRQLALELELNPEVLGRNIAKNSGREFLYVKRRLPPADADRILALDIEGVHVQQEYQRFYPQGEVAAHLIGFSNVDDVGQEGLELGFAECRGDARLCRTDVAALSRNSILSRLPAPANGWSSVSIFVCRIWPIES